MADNLTTRSAPDDFGETGKDWLGGGLAQTLAKKANSTPAGFQEGQTQNGSPSNGVNGNSSLRVGAGSVQPADGSMHPVQQEISQAIGAGSSDSHIVGARGSDGAKNGEVAAVADRSEDVCFGSCEDIAVDTGGDEGDDVDCNEVDETNDGCVGPRLKGCRIVTRERLLELVEFCLKRSALSQQKELERLHRDLSQHTSALSTRVAGNPGSKDLCTEIQGLFDAVAAAPDERAVQRLLSSSPLSVSRVARDPVDREMRRWWSVAMERAAVRICDAREGKALHDRLVSTLPVSDSDISGVPVELCRSLKQQIEQVIQEQVKPKTTVTCLKPFREVLRDGGQQLEAAVEQAMGNATASWVDGKIRRSAQRLHNATSANSFASVATSTTSDAVRKTLNSVSVPPAGHGHNDIDVAAAARPAMIPTARLMERLRAVTDPVSEALGQLSQDVHSARDELTLCSNLLDEADSDCHAPIGLPARLRDSSLV